MSLSAVQIYDFHIFAIVNSSLYGFIWNQLYDQLPVGLLAQLILEIDAFHDHLNGQNTDIQYTREVEENSNLPFLDCLVSQIETDQSRPTYTSLSLTANNVTAKLTDRYQFKQTGLRTPGFKPFTELSLSYILSNYLNRFHALLVRWEKRSKQRSGFVTRLA